jgi:hypothetical protein
LLPELQQTSAAAIELFASVELKPDVVRIKIFDAAKRGQCVLRLPIPSHLDVRKTNAAAELVKWCKENELTLEWQKREATLPDSRSVIVFEPEINWAAKS